MEPITEQESEFRHSGWAIRRVQVWNGFVATGTSSSRLDRFANCGSALWLEKNQAGTDLRLRCNRCHDRWCIPCMNERALSMRENLHRLCDGKEVRMVTLTLRHSATPLLDQVQRLYDCFSKLRRRRPWILHVTGGAAFLELKLSEKDGLWHVHLHCLCVGNFWNQREISTEWHAVTGDSSIVDVRKVQADGSAICYVTKYVTKVADASVYREPNRLQEAIISLRGRRMCTTFGTWRGAPLEDKPQDDTVWLSLGSVENLASNASRGDQQAIGLLQAAARKWPIFATLFALPPPAA